MSIDDEWMSLAEQASIETDPAKLDQLISQLCAAIDRKHNRQKANLAHPPEKKEVTP